MKKIVLGICASTVLLVSSAYANFTVQLEVINNSGKTQYIQCGSGMGMFESKQEVIPADGAMHSKKIVNVPPFGIETRGACNWGPAPWFTAPHGQPAVLNYEGYNGPYADPSWTVTINKDGSSATYGGIAHN